VPTRLIEDERIRVLKDTPAGEGGYVLYWMQQSQRAEDNPALEHAVRRANELGVPVLVGFGVMDGYPEVNLRHYRFMLEGLEEVAGALARRDIPFVLAHGDPDDVAVELAAGAALVVCDRGYLRHQKAWRRSVVRRVSCRVEQVEADVVVPLELYTDKRQYAARTIRPRIHRHLDDFLVELRTTPLDADAGGLDAAAVGAELAELDPSDPSGTLARLDIDRSVPAVSCFFQGGTTRAKTRLRRLLDDGMDVYDDHRNQPHTDDTSHLSPYLHFGQVSPVWATGAVRTSGAGTTEARESFVEELVVRRELAMNFVHFEPEYDEYGMLPGWAKETLDDHRDDDREHVYSLEELECARTHDDWWNAAQREMRYTGYMHNYMRMYWGKQILAWSPTPEEAYRRTLHLNNKYFLDGRDPASFANVGWLFGLHDRAWQERDVFGKVRILTPGGLRRKTDPDAYVDKVDRLVARAREHGVVFDEEPA